MQILKHFLLIFFTKRIKIIKKSKTMKNKTINDLLKSLREEKLLKAIAKNRRHKARDIGWKAENRTENPPKKTKGTKYKKRKKRIN